MPYAIHRDGEEYVVTKKDGGEEVGRTDSMMKASAMVKAIYANENKGK